MARILVIGSSNTDMTVRVPRLPAVGQTVLGSGFATTAGGKGANQAVAARRAGGEVTFVTAVGDDSLGRNAVELFGRHGIGTSHIKICKGVASGVALIFVDEQGENMIGVASGANLELAPDDIDRLPVSLFRDGDVLLTGLEIPLETAARAIARGAAAGMCVILNPAPVPRSPDAITREILSRVDVITPNRIEALALAELSMDPGAETNYKLAAERLLARGAAAAVITLGARGCLVASPGGEREIAAPEVEAVDTVGAGDAFNGALAVALGEGRPLEAAAAWATHAAALAVMKPGAQDAMPAREEIDRMQGRA